MRHNHTNGRGYKSNTYVKQPNLPNVLPTNPSEDRYPEEVFQQVSREGEENVLQTLRSTENSVTSRVELRIEMKSARGRWLCQCAAPPNRVPGDVPRCLEIDCAGAVMDTRLKSHGPREIDVAEYRLTKERWL